MGASVWDKGLLETGGGDSCSRSGLSAAQATRSPPLTERGGPGLPTAPPTASGTLVPCPKEQVPPALKVDQLEIGGQVGTAEPGVLVLLRPAEGGRPPRGSVAPLSSDHSPKMPGPGQARGGGGSR